MTYNVYYSGNNIGWVTKVQANKPSQRWHAGSAYQRNGPLFRTRRQAVDWVLDLYHQMHPAHLSRTSKVKLINPWKNA
jgi:hypothetical protein